MVHYATFDSNSVDDAARLDAQLDWLEADLAASTARWKIVVAHHPVAGTPDKSEQSADNYYKQVVPRLRAAGVDLLLTGHSHTYSWTYPLIGNDGDNATFVVDADNDYAKGAGLVQVVSGVGGRTDSSWELLEPPVRRIRIHARHSDRGQNLVSRRSMLLLTSLSSVTWRPTTVRSSISLRSPIQFCRGERRGNGRRRIRNRGRPWRVQRDPHR